MVEQTKSTADEIKSLSKLNVNFYETLISELPEAFNSMIYELASGKLYEIKNIESVNIEIAYSYYYLNLVKELNSLKVTLAQIKKMSN